jgi:hypothetical protein
MNYRNSSAPAQPAGRTLGAIGKHFFKTCGQTAVLTIVLAMATAPLALAQQAAPAAKPKPPAKPGAPAAQTAPAPQPQQQAPAAAGQGGDQQQQVQLIYSPWTKFCLKGQNWNAGGRCCLDRTGG